MQAVFIHDFNESSVQEIDEPTPAADEVLLEVKRVQLSVTECFAYRGQRAQDRLRAAVADGPARQFGHEFAAEVIETGADVDGYDVGDRVYAPGKIPCYDCAYCDAGMNHFCKSKSYIGRDYPGALAEVISLPTEPLCPLPDAVSNKEGAALQPLASTLLCVNDANITFGDTVVIVGAGVMGFQAGQVAQLLGADPVVSIDIVPEKLEYARERGMIALNGRETDVEEYVDDLTDGVGADIVAEAVGGDQSNFTEGDDPIAQAFRMARSGGTILQIGIILGDMTLTPDVVRSKAVRWVNPALGRMSFGPNAESGALAAKLVASGNVSIEEYTTHELDGLESFEEAVEITLNKDEHGALGPAQIVVSE